MDDNMNVSEDMYLSLAIELYRKGTWTMEVLKRKLYLYAEEKSLDKSLVEEMIRRELTTREYTVEEKKAFLSVMRLADGKELKYGEIIYEFEDKMIEDIYEFEIKSLSNEKIDDLHKLASIKVQNQVEVSEEIPSEIKIDEKNEEVVVTEDIKEEQVEEPIKEEMPVEEEKNAAEGWYTPASNDNNGWYSSLNEVSVEDYYGPKTKQERVEINPVIPEMPLGSEIPDEVSELVEEPNGIEENVASDGKVVIGDIFGSFGDMAETEEEFQEVAKNINAAEKDSSVRFVDASPERIQRLKLNKGKVKNYFIKTAVVLVALTMSAPINTIPLIGGYAYFAHRIKSGKFIPKNKFERGFKSLIEKVMYVGMTEEEKEEERGKSR